MTSSSLSAEVKRALRPHLYALLGFSVAANLLLLVSPLYMLQVYDRVLSSGSQDTLIWLTVLAVFLLGVYGAAEAGRRRVCALASGRFEALIAPRVFARFGGDGTSNSKLSHDLALMNRVQNMLQAGTALPFVDLPFSPIFILVLFLVHPMLGMLGIVGALVVFAVAYAAETTTRQSSGEAQGLLNATSEFAQGLERQRSAMIAMGLVPRAFQTWWAGQSRGRGLSLDAARNDGKFTAISRASRQVLQIFILGGGAMLALSQDISPGSIVASSIILARALGPVDQIVGGWRNSVTAWRAWKTLQEELAAVKSDAGFTPLPRPDSRLVLDRLAVSVPGAATPLIRPFSFKAEGGHIIALTGGNGSGKTTLLQTLSGAWPSGGGHVRLGGRDIHEWAHADRGRYVGYVPQDVELLPASITGNIARLQETDNEAVFAAARSAGAHDMILSLPDGYDTRVGPGGVHLSAGQRQMIGLARAFFGQPVFVLLDEPTANLDAAAAPVLIEALQAAADAGAIIIAATHDRRLIQAAKTVLLVRAGTVMSAPSEDYLKLATGPGAGTPGGKGAVG